MCLQYRVPVSSNRLPDSIRVNPDLSSDDEDVVLSSRERTPGDTSGTCPELEERAGSPLPVGPVGSPSNQDSTNHPPVSTVDQSPTSSSSNNSVYTPVLLSPMSFSDGCSSKSMPSLSPVADTLCQSPLHNTTPSTSSVTTSKILNKKTHRHSKTIIGEQMSNVRQLRSAMKQNGRYNLRNRTKQ